MFKKANESLITVFIFNYFVHTFFTNSFPKGAKHGCFLQLIIYYNHTSTEYFFLNILQFFKSEQHTLKSFRCSKISSHLFSHIYLDLFLENYYLLKSFYLKTLIHLRTPLLFKSRSKKNEFLHKFVKVEGSCGFLKETEKLWGILIRCTSNDTSVKKRKKFSSVFALNSTECIEICKQKTVTHCRGCILKGANCPKSCKWWSCGVSGLFWDGTFRRECEFAGTRRWVRFSWCLFEQLVHNLSQNGYLEVECFQVCLKPLLHYVGRIFHAGPANLFGYLRFGCSGRLFLLCGPFATGFQLVLTSTSK